MKNRLTHNLGLKILSIFLAALLWLTIMNEADPVITDYFYNIPVQIINDEVITSRGYQYSVETGEQVTVKVKGKRTNVDSLTDLDFKATADLNTLNSMYMATISVECTAECASELDVSLRTETLAIKLEDQITEPYNVRIVKEGEVKDGFYCTDCRVISSPLVQVTGSLTQMGELKEIVARVNIDGKSSSFTESCELVAYDLHGNEIDPKKLSFSQNIVDVTVDIYPTKLVNLEAVTINNPAEGYYVDKIEYAPATVLIAAEEDKLKRLDKIMVPCDVSEAAETVNLQINNINEFLNGVSDYGGCYSADSAAYISVVITIKPVSEMELTISESDIGTENLADNLECTVYSLWDSRVIVKGPESELAEITPADLGLYVDMADCVAGTYSRQLKYRYEGNLTVSAGTVMVKLNEKTLALEDSVIE